MIQELDQQYIERLEELAGEIQESPELQQYLDTEEEEDFNHLKELYEPRISMIYEEVAATHPLQLIYMEKILLDDAFEGLFLPKILGYSVLRGEVGKDYKYVRPQDHFRDVLMAICDSANFDILKKRIGQSIQVGFALSSDIWITNLINEVQNKRIRYYLRSQKLEKYRVEKERAIGYMRYKKQFGNDNFQSAEIPQTLSELKVLFSPLKLFLIHRIKNHNDNSSLVPVLMEFIQQEDFQGTDEHLQILTLFASFFSLEDDELQKVREIFNKLRTEKADFQEKYFDFVLEMHNDPEIRLDGEADLRIAALLDENIKDELKTYYALMTVIHTKGYITEEAQEAVKVFYNRYQGLSTINECVRRTIFNYFAQLIRNLEVSDYQDYFEITKVFTVYMAIFSNQHFNQDLKDLSMAYIKRLLKNYTDKRGKDYQDIKKFVSTTFVDLNFLNEKEVVELFKTRRKKRAKTPA